MKKIVLNLSNLKGAAREYVAENVKQDLEMLGFKLNYRNGQQHDAHMGFSISAGSRNVEFDFNNENQATIALMYEGASFFNEHQINEFLETAEEMLRSNDTSGDETHTCKPIEFTAHGIKIRMCQHGYKIELPVMEMVDLLANPVGLLLLDMAVMRKRKELGWS
jgi:hypothetical protein